MSSPCTFYRFLWKKRTTNASYKENTSRERSLDRSYNSQCQKMNKKTLHWCPRQSSTEKMDHEADPKWLGLKLSLVWLKTGLKDEVSQVLRHVGVAVAHGLRNYMYWIWTWECRESVWVTGTEQPCQEPVSPLVWNCLARIRNSVAFQPMSFWRLCHVIALPWPERERESSLTLFFWCVYVDLRKFSSLPGFIRNFLTLSYSSSLET